MTGKHGKAGCAGEEKCANLEAQHVGWEPGRGSDGTIDVHEEERKEI